MDSKFIEVLAEVLDIYADSIIDAETLILDPQDNWDSIAMLSAIAVIDDEYGIQLDGDDLRNCKSAKDLYILIQKNS